MGKPKVLFLCTGNSCRSQMGEGFLRDMAGDKFEVMSAGMDPSGEVHPLAVRVMDEVGIDISGQKPKDISQFLGDEEIAYVIIVCDKANKTCPLFSPTLADQNRIFWPFDDPAHAEGTDEEKLEFFRRVRDEIRAKITDWLKSME